MPRVINTTPSATAQKTDAQLQDQGVTYNQSGATYNDIRYTYGGLYEYENLSPLISQAKNQVPKNAGISDIYTNKQPPVTIGYPVGPGFFMFIQNK